MVTVNSTVPSDYSPERPPKRRYVRKFVPPPEPLMTKYSVEIKQGADTLKVIPWWGPLNANELFDEIHDEGLVPTQCWYEGDK